MKRPFVLESLNRNLVAILRGIQPHEIENIVAGLINSGLRAIEIPLNSPDPFSSIEIAVDVAEKSAPGECLIGAGTVLSIEDVQRVHSVGGNLCVSPNTNASVIEEAISKQMISMPGVFTATEAHLALASGASALKFFPGSLLGASGISAIKTILPNTAQVYAVGGIGPADFSEYLNAGVDGFGLGSGLYKPGDVASVTVQKARATVAAYDRALG